MQQDNNTMLIIVVIAAWFAYTFYTRSKRKTAVSRKLMESPKIIDVRDLAGWVIRMIEDHTTGVFNATGPEKPLTMQEVLDVSKGVSKSAGGK